MVRSLLDIPKELVIFKPQEGSQGRFLSCPYFEALYEGTRGPGKTISLLMDFAQHVGQGYGSYWRGILFRREYKELDDAVTKSKSFFHQIFPGAKFLESLSSYKWIFPDGEELLFRNAKRESDYWSYHGHEYPWIGFDELTTWPNDKLYESLMSVCRSSSPECPRKYRASANPYGVGHNWVKARFIDPSPARKPIKDKFGRYRVAIHGTIWENKIFLKANPGYLSSLQAITDPNKRAAWLEGSWDITAGGMFDDLFSREKHILEPFDIPKSWYIDRSFDWGSSAPFSIGWWAESDGTEVRLRDNTKKNFPRGTIFLINEWYGWNGKANEGLRYTASEIARGILNRERQYLQRYVNPGPADSSIYDVEDGHCYADEMASVGVRWIRADKSSGSRRNGWELLRERLNASLKTPMEKPGFFIFSNCRHWIRTVPTLPRDENNPDDVDKDAEDHAGDMTRYRILHRKQFAQRVHVEGI